MREPWITRLRTSRPKRSVPSQAWLPGAVSTRSKFCSSGGCGARKSAKAAMARTSSANTVPATTTALRNVRRRRRPQESSTATWGAGMVVSCVSSTVGSARGKACQDTRARCRGLSRPTAARAAGRGGSASRWYPVGVSFEGAHVRYAAEKGVGRITLTRPRVLNALHTPLVEELAECAARAERDPDAAVVVVTGEGRAFSSGMDRTALSAGEIGEPFFRHWIRALNRL